MTKPIETYCTAAGVYHDSVAVEFDSWPAEPDVNVSEGIEITHVWLEDQGNIIDTLSESEMTDLEDRMLGDMRQDAEDRYHDAADHAYEQMKDRKLGL